MSASNSTSAPAGDTTPSVPHSAAPTTLPPSTTSPPRRKKPTKHVPSLPLPLRMLGTFHTAAWLIGGWVVGWAAQVVASAIAYPFTDAEQRTDLCSRIFHLICYFTCIKTNPLWTTRLLRPMPDISAHKKVIVMMNHLSNADPYLCTGMMLPRDSKWICKASLGKVPFGGWALHNGGALFVQFSKDGSGGVKKGTVGAMMAKAKEYISTGRLVSVFPEGTRSLTPEQGLNPFKMGFFLLAVEIGATIVPCALSGTEKMWPNGEMFMDKGTAYVSYGDPIVPKEGETAEELRDRVFKVISEMRDSHPDRVALLAKQK